MLYKTLPFPLTTRSGFILRLIIHYLLCVVHNQMLFMVYRFYCSIKEELIFYSLEQDLVTVPWVCGRYQRRCWLRPRSVRMWKVFLVTPTSLTALSRTSRKSSPTPTTAKCVHWPSTTAIRLAAVLDSCDWKLIACALFKLTVSLLLSHSSIRSWVLFL